MSSQLLSSLHFNSVQECLTPLMEKREFVAYVLDPLIKDFNFPKFMNTIRSISVRSFFTQYKDHYPDHQKEIFQSTKDLILNQKKSYQLSLVDCINSLRSMDYQIEVCEELNLTDYEKKCLDDLIKLPYVLSLYIVRESRRYQDSRTWSIE